MFSTSTVNAKDRWFKSGDVASLAETINRLLSNPVLREEIGRNVRISIRDYSWEGIAKKTEEIYIKTLKKRNGY